MVVPAVQIEAEYLNRYEVRDNALHLIINLRALFNSLLYRLTQLHNLLRKLPHRFQGLS